MGIGVGRMSFRNFIDLRINMSFTMVNATRFQVQTTAKTSNCYIFAIFRPHRRCTIGDTGTIRCKAIIGPVQELVCGPVRCRASAPDRAPLGALPPLVH